ncbi:MAG: DUF222 domain-containing protein, partial [Actinomycetota bacterium]
MLAAILPVEAEGSWRGDGARDFSHWLSMRFGISEWKARRHLAAAHALESLPQLSSALTSGRLGLDKTLELARFATPDDESRLIRWAERVSPATVRRRGDKATRPPADDIEAAQAARFVRWCHDDESHLLNLEAAFPVTHGVKVARAIDRIARSLTPMPGEEHFALEARRADALVGICGASIAADPDADRATLVVHADLQTLIDGEGMVESEGGPLIPAVAAQRLLCDARVQTLVENRDGRVVQLAEIRREPPAWMVRQVRRRDQGCVFPGCGTQAFTEAHHIRFWSQGGRTDLDNLALVCSFHHRLVHEHRWRLERAPDGTVH